MSYTSSCTETNYNQVYYNESAINGALFDSPFCTTETINTYTPYNKLYVSKNFDKSEQVIDVISNSINGCRAFGNLVKNFSALQCQMVNIIMSSSSDLQQIASSTQIMNIIIENSVITCDNIKIQNISTKSMYIFNSMSAQLNAELTSTLEINTKDMFYDAINVLTEEFTQNAQRGREVIEKFNNSINSQMFVDIVNTLETEISQFASNIQIINFRLKNAIIGGPSCKNLEISNLSIINMATINSMSSFVNLVLTQTTYLKDIEDFATEIDKVYKGENLPDVPEEPEDLEDLEENSIWVYILIIFITIIILLIITYFALKPAPKNVNYNVTVKI
jgi:hypothetical protein